MSTYASTVRPARKPSPATDSLAYLEACEEAERACRAMEAAQDTHGVNSIRAQVAEAHYEAWAERRASFER